MFFLIRFGTEEMILYLFLENHSLKLSLEHIPQNFLTTQVQSMIIVP